MVTDEDPDYDDPRLFPFGRPWGRRSRRNAIEKHKKSKITVSSLKKRSRSKSTTRKDKGMW